MSPINPTKIKIFGEAGTFKTNNNDISATKISTVGQSVYQLSSNGDNGFKANTAGVGGLGTTLDYNKLMESGTEKTVTDNNIYKKVQGGKEFGEKRR